MSEDCLFCRIVARDVPGTLLHEDDLVVAFDIPDGHPEKRAPVHFLVIPKDHIASANEARQEHEPVIGRLVTVAACLAREKGVSESGFRLVSNTGRDAHQTVFHLHLHCAGGRDLGAGTWAG